MAGKPTPFGAKTFSKTADLRSALLEHCEGSIRAFLAKHSADRTAFPRLVLEAKACCEPEPKEQPIFREGLGTIAQLVSGDMGRQLDLLMESIPELAGKLSALVTEHVPRLVADLDEILTGGLDALKELETATANVDAESRQKLETLSEKLRVFEGLRTELSNLRQATIGSDEIRRGTPHLATLAASKSAATTLTTLADIAATDPNHPNSGALRALLTVARWRQEAVAQATDFESLVGLFSRPAKPRNRLAQRFSEGFRILVGSDWKTIPLNARQIACLSILCGNLPGVVEGADLSKPILNPPLKGRLVLDQETQTMRVHLRELRGLRLTRFGGHLSKQVEVVHGRQSGAEAEA